jgi:oligoribonuclease NrnB/cAMP/cGMP phosphodiesterase (DHH superfamily)
MEYLSCSSNNVLYITDISPSDPAIANMLDEFNGKNGNRVVMIDHHKTAMEDYNHFSWTHFDTSKCGTLLFFEHLWERCCQECLSIYRDFAELVNDYDMWHRKDQNSDRMNMLLYAIGKERFVKRYESNGYLEPHLFSDFEEEFLAILVENNAAYIDDAIKTGRVLRCEDGSYSFVVFAEKLQSLIAEEVRKRGISSDFVAVVDTQKCKVSLRSNRPDCDVSILARKYGGGGHVRSAGFEFDKNLANKMWGLIF